MNVDLYIANPQGLANTDAGILKIGPRVDVVKACFDDFNLLALVGGKLIFGKKAVFPKIMQEFFRDIHNAGGYELRKPWIRYQKGRKPGLCA